MWLTGDYRLPSHSCRPNDIASAEILKDAGHGYLRLTCRQQRDHRDLPRPGRTNQKASITLDACLERAAALEKARRDGYLQDFADTYVAISGQQIVEEILRRNGLNKWLEVYKD